MANVPYSNSLNVTYVKQTEWMGNANWTTLNIFHCIFLTIFCLGSLYFDSRAVLFVTFVKKRNTVLMVILALIAHISSGKSQWNNRKFLTNYTKSWIFREFF